MSSSWKSDYASRNTSEPGKASLRDIAVVNLPEVAKPDTYWEATAECTNMAARSRTGWRV
jgi:hypothetical protein